MAKREQQIVINAAKTKVNRGNRTKGRQHLKPHQYKKGQSGNPTGRPKGASSKVISTAYTAVLDEPIDDDVAEKLNLPKGCTWSYAIAKQQARRALAVIDGDKVNMGSVQELREVTEGKLVEKQELGGPNQTPLAQPTFITQFVDPPPYDEPDKVVEAKPDVELAEPSPDVEPEPIPDEWDEEK